MPWPKSSRQPGTYSSSLISRGRAKKTDKLWLDDKLDKLLDFSTSHVSDLSMAGDMGIIIRGEDSDMGTERSEVSISLFSPRVIM